MTILVTPDLHLNALARDQYRHDFQKQLRALVTKHRVHTVFILGDLTDEKDFHSATLVNKVVDHMQELAQLTKVVILKGNHDYTSVATVPYFAFLKHLIQIEWIGEPMILPGPNLLLLPHTPNPVRDWEKRWNFEAFDWVFAHQTFEVAKAESGRVMEGASAALFKGTKVISGDVHVPQTLGPVTYVGSPYTIDFGDDFAPRVLLLNGTKMQSIPCTGPQKRLVQFRIGDKLPTGGLNKGDILKVRVELDIGQYAQWAAIKDNIMGWGAKHGFVIHLVQPVTQQTGQAKKASPRAAPKSDTELLKGYATRQKVDARTVRVGLDLMKGV